MLSIILNNLFTRNRKDMAAAEKAKHTARRHQRLNVHKPEPDAQDAPAAPVAAKTKPDKS